MDLAKQCVDVGLFTNRLDQMRAFWGERIGLKYEEMLPLGGGVRQHRYGLSGSVLKINAARDTLPVRRASGYRRIVIADPRITSAVRMEDPDGNEVKLVPFDHEGVRQIELELGVTDESAFERFYREVLEGERLAPTRYRIGDTIIRFTADLAAERRPRASAGNGGAAMASIAAVGFRYITVQVRDCDAEHRRMLKAGAWEGSAPVTLGSVARICFIRDPDGNWIEVSQRASLTGPLPK